MEGLQKHLSKLAKVSPTESLSFWITRKVTSALFSVFASLQFGFFFIGHPMKCVTDSTFSGKKNNRRRARLSFAVASEQPNDLRQFSSRFIIFYSF